MAKYAKLIPVTTAKNKRLAIRKATATTKNNTKITRANGNDILRFKATMYMTNGQAHQIADLLNSQNSLKKVAEHTSILNQGTDFQFLVDADNKTVTGCVRMQCKKRRKKARPARPGKAPTKGEHVSEARISRLSTHPDHQRTGLATSLLMKTEKQARDTYVKRLYAHILQSNEPSQRLFEKMGYKKDFVFYKNDSDDLLAYWSKQL